MAIDGRSQGVESYASHIERLTKSITDAEAQLTELETAADFYRQKAEALQQARAQSHRRHTQRQAIGP